VAVGEVSEHESEGGRQGDALVGRAGRERMKCVDPIYSNNGGGKYISGCTPRGRGREESGIFPVRKKGRVVR